jgi:hypothetical protein
VLTTGLIHLTLSGASGSETATFAGTADITNGVYIGGSAAANLLDDYEEGTWTPTWAVESGAAPSIGNGTLTGRYTKIGRVVTVELGLVGGSTTTFGGGNWRFNYPITPASIVTGGKVFTAPAYCEDAGTGWTVGTGVGRGTTYWDIDMQPTGTVGVNRVTFNDPFTWTTGDNLAITFTYTAA